MKEFNGLGLIARIEEMVAEVSSDRHCNGCAIIVTEEEQSTLMAAATDEENDCQVCSGEEENVADSDSDSDSTADTPVLKKSHRFREGGGDWRRQFRRLRQRQKRGQVGGPLRVGRPSWWTECKNVETTGCTFALAYLLSSFCLLAIMFNMREIVGDYCLGNQEQRTREYQENVVKAMLLRRRRPHSADLEDRFEKEMQTQLYYDHQGQQLEEDTEYSKRHRVPIILPNDAAVQEDGADDDLMRLESEP